MINKIVVCLSCVVLGFSVGAAAAETGSEDVQVKITKDVSSVMVEHEGQMVKIERIQDQEHMLTGGFAKTSRKCPPFCVNPISLDPDVKTVGELEILKFMQTHLKDGSGVLIDARTPEWYNKGTIPGSVNIPFTKFGMKEDDPELARLLLELGVFPKSGNSEGFMDKITGMFGEKKKPSKWDFSQSKELLLWCNGIWCGQSPRAIQNLVALGYPKEKLRWYRGGMQVWRILGLTVTIPGAQLGV